MKALDNKDKIGQEVETARSRLADLYQRAGTSTVPQAVLDEALEELSSALEELGVTTEELRQQNDELAATRELAEAQRRHYQELFDFAPDGYLVTDSQATIQEANHRVAELLGVRPRLLMGKPLILFIPQPGHKAFRDLLTRLEKGEQPDSWEMEMQPRHGSPFPAAVTVSIIRQSKKSGWLPIGLRWLVRDITERKKGEKQVENQLRRITALRDINLAVTSTLELQNVLELLLDQLDRALPYPTATTIRLFHSENGRLEPLFCRNLDAQEWRAGGRQAPGPRLEDAMKLRAPFAVRNVQNDARSRRPEFYRKNGLVSYLAVPLVISGQIIGFLSVYTKQEHEFSPEEIDFLSTVGTQAAIAIQNSRLYEEVKQQAVELKRAHDQLEERVRERTGRLTAEIVERNRAEEKLRESEGRLAELLKQLEQQLIASDRLVSIGELAASVAHEFNNPLQIIMGFAQELLDETKPSQPQHEPLSIIEAETRRCREIIRNLLDFARPVEAERTLVAVEPIVRDGIRLVFHYLQMAKVRVEIDIQPDLPPISADAQQLQQVLMNLAFNAAEAMPSGGKLAVRATARAAGAGTDAHGPELIIAVADTGTGIPKENMVNIFRPFFSTKKKKGMGLGLSICERIVEAHGGRILVESEPGKGATFYLHFPLREARQYGRAS